jgi:hypothetical protein
MATGLVGGEVFDGNDQCMIHFVFFFTTLAN